MTSDPTHPSWTHRYVPHHHFIQINISAVSTHALALQRTWRNLTPLHRTLEPAPKGPGPSDPEGQKIQEVRPVITNHQHFYVPEGEDVSVMDVEVNELLNSKIKTKAGSLHFLLQCNCEVSFLCVWWEACHRILPECTAHDCMFKRSNISGNTVINFS